MIVKMTKYSFLVYHKEYAAFLEQMRELGVLHVIQKQVGAPVEGTELEREMATAQRFEKAYKECIAHLGGDYSECKAVTKDKDPLSLVADLEEINNSKARLNTKIAALDKEIERMQVWGDFSWESVYRLHDVGYIVRFWSCNERNFQKSFEDDYNAIRINQVGAVQYFVTITHEGQIVGFDDAERVRLPKESLKELLREKASDLSSLQELDKVTDEFHKQYFWSIEAGYRAVLESIDYQKVVLNSESAAENSVYHLEGWVPSDSEEQVNAFLESNGIYFESQKATKSDPAPIKLKNGGLAKLFHPITELYDLPAYGERDLTPFFAPFFVMFFGLCLGDAGYGLLLTAIGLIARAKVKPSLKSYMSLLTVLGIGTIIFGFFSGTLFGIQLLEVNWAWIQSLKAFMMDSTKLFYFSLGVGVFQILFGMVLKAVGQTHRFGFKEAIPAWGWLILLGGCGATFGLSELGVLDGAVASILYYVFGITGALGIFIFNDVKRNPLVNVGAGVWDSYNMASGLLGDVLSYVRLFALGISGSVLGLVFNDLAMKMSPDIPVVGFLVSLVILVFGHSINIFMSGLGAFVHPMRLTFVEFYKNAGFEGGGKKYNPFAKRVKKEN